MAQVTWKGEPGSSQESMEWRGHTFKKGEAVEVTDEETIKKAQGNKYFEVSGVEKSDQEKASAAPASYQAPQATPRPSQTPAQGPVPKPGEPQPGPSPGQNPQPMTRK